MRAADFGLCSMNMRPLSPIDFALCARHNHVTTNDFSDVPETTLVDDCKIRGCFAVLADFKSDLLPSHH